MRISKEKLAQLKKRKRSGSSNGRLGFRGVITGGAVGAGAALAYETAGSSIAFLRDNWYAGPIVMLGTALALGRSGRMRTPATALAGAGGFSTYTNYRLSKAREAKGLVGTPRASYGGIHQGGAAAQPRVVAS